MANLSIDNNIIDWIQLFLTKRSIELVTDRFTTLWKKVEIRILQSLSVFTILFLIYISKVFFIIEAKQQMLYSIYDLQIA